MMPANRKTAHAQRQRPFASGRSRLHVAAPAPLDSQPAALSRAGAYWADARSSNDILEFRSRHSR
ncbi:hypothetical protein ABD76_27005 [Paenibacillus dendritiformis]|uniref:hypothetical protein n=1 Tax=Paenibacillus dendritiformis TaxID=130049 RepID=UPI0018CEF8EF|nr:hypothetical protein [Paenibacillus dendritiformis]MBG9795889.1 hypothetical protein [Paenibacillus dendritiformis]